jgi:hypothetical protein
MPIEEILKISQGLLTPVIAIVATYIAWRQWKVTNAPFMPPHTDSELGHKPGFSLHTPNRRA